MKIYDISQEIFSCEAYPGDPTPEKTEPRSFKENFAERRCRSVFRSGKSICFFGYFTFGK